MPPQMTQQELLQLLREIVGPQFENLRNQMADLKDLIQSTMENHSKENERQRDNVKDLYDKDREKSAEITAIKQAQAQFEGRMMTELGKIEQAIGNIQEAKTEEKEAKRFTTSQWIIIAGILSATILGTVTLILTIHAH